MYGQAFGTDKTRYHITRSDITHKEKKLKARKGISRLAFESYIPIHRPSKKPSPTTTSHSPLYSYRIVHREEKSLLSANAVQKNRPLCMYQVHRKQMSAAYLHQENIAPSFHS
jgi:hypothetical protein